MAAQDSDGEEDFVTYGKPLEQYEEGEQPKKPTPLQDQTVKDEKGRYKRFHGAFTGGFSAGYFNTVGSKEGWTPSTFVSSRQGRPEKHSSRPEDFMDEEDLGEFGIAPKEIMTTDDFASKTKDKIREKARELAAVTAPIPGATILEDLIAPAKITVGVQLLRQMGWKEGQGVGPRTKRKVRKQEPERGSKVYGCALPPTGSEGSEDEEDEYLPENVTFAPKDVTPIDFTVKDDVHGLGYRGLDPRQALFGSLDSHVNLFGDGSDRTFAALGDVRRGKGRKVGISGQAFGVGALEDEDDDIYGTDSLSKYDTVIREESGDGLFGWTAPKEYKNKKGSSKELQYIGKVLEGFSIATQPTPQKKVYMAPELPRDYRPVHYFRPVLNAANQNSVALQAALVASSHNPPTEPKKDQQASRHKLSSSQRREMLGEEALQGPSSVLDLLSDKDREKIRDVRQTIQEQRLKAQKLAQDAIKNRFQAASADEAQNRLQDELLDRQLVPTNAEEFRPFDRDPEKQKRYDVYIRKLHEGKKDALESCLDSSMTEWERSREREEFMRSAMLYKPTNSSLSSRFTRGKYEDESESVEVPRDQEGDLNDKSAAVKMKMFGRLTRDRFEWRPDKLLCKRFNIPDPYPGSTFTGLPKVKRDKYSVFNFLTVPEPPPPIHAATQQKASETSDNKQKKSSRWDMSSTEVKKDPLSAFLSQARGHSEAKEQKDEGKEKKGPPPAPAAAPTQGQTDQNEEEEEEEEEEKRPSIDLFKAIFADSSDEKSSSSEEESDEESALPGEDAEGSRPEVAPPPVVREPEVAPPVPPAARAVTDRLEKMEDEEEFGPRLPPALPSATLRTSSDSPSLSRDESSKKQKPKKHKEKHKVKKEHKHKKEKKKKHKKQKHKNKHKNKKETEDSTDSEDGSSDLSNPEEAAKMTPRELLKRLKNLPIPH